MAFRAFRGRGLGSVGIKLGSTELSPLDLGIAGEGPGGGGMGFKPAGCLTETGRMAELSGDS